MDSKRAFRVGIAVLSVLGGTVVLLIAHDVLPYLSSNHDEGVYLQQAAMLLEGNLWLKSVVPDAVRPWFFIQDGQRLYPKYTPVAALMYAPGVMAGVPRVILGLIAAGNIALVGTITSELFDRRTGVLAAGFALATPFFLFISAAFMAYAPTTLLNLLFALGYIRMFRRSSKRYAVLAGGAIGIAFFSRSYTAVLFALPFVVHAATVVGQDLSQRSFWTPTIQREAIVGVLGIAGVGVTLAYNHILTGDALVFPYQAFAPLDGLGFGHRKLIDRKINYTIGLAWRANKHLIAELFTRWTVAPPIGSLLAAVGVFAFALGYRQRRTAKLSDRTLGIILLGTCLSILLGNIYFWGTLNTLGTVAAPTDGFMSRFGPFYHFDLILPLSAFGSAGALWIGGTLRSVLSQRYSTQQLRVLFLALLAVSAVVGGSAEYDRLDTAIEKHASTTEQQRSVAELFENRTFENALVFMPTPYGPWLSHPFQSLRNGGSLEKGSVLYAQDRGPGLNFLTLDAYSNRTPYRFTYRGQWPGVVTPHLHPLTVTNDSSHRFTTTVTSVGAVSSVQVRTGTDRVIREPPINGTGRMANDSLNVTWSINETHATLNAINGKAVPQRSDEYEQEPPLSGAAPTPATPRGVSSTSIELNGSTRVTLSITFDRPNGDILTYWYQVDVDPNTTSTRVLWPNERKVCNDARYCGHEGTYIPGEKYPGGAAMNTTYAASAEA
ncbi:ArnT family glycosyltransferase [Halocatena pleomorpha]|uniref:DUF7846 domain-containing protein n=1 Tax=Halocatena pleomorpha TaxID=1785090 RepID=A0A3P3R8Z8_9EURY|nr:glycosyltransferase family 39 protein [Halocatena pleomorpha]RRJ29854.1 hypothetical protein EIK79_11685 [Halocatena pleomorpha]